MDDDMFAGIGLQNINSTDSGIKSAALIPEGLIAEKGQVMVIVPGERAKKAEMSLAALQSTLVWTLAGFVLIVGLYIYFFWFKKPVEYQGRALPAIGVIDEETKEQVDPLKNIKHVKLVKQSKKIQLTDFEKDIPVHDDEVPSMPEPELDVIRVMPPFPVYSNFDHEEPDNEKKVSDTDADIIKKMKARDDFMKDIEKSHTS
jgi:hypothetical protein